MATLGTGLSKEDREKYFKTYNIGRDNLYDMVKVTNPEYIRQCGNISDDDFSTAISHRSWNRSRYIFKVDEIYGGRACVDLRTVMHRYDLIGFKSLPGGIDPPELMWDLMEIRWNDVSPYREIKTMSGWKELKLNDPTRSRDSNDFALHLIDSDDDLLIDGGQMARIPLRLLEEWGLLDEEKRKECSPSGENLNYSVIEISSTDVDNPRTTFARLQYPQTSADNEVDLPYGLIRRMKLSPGDKVRVRLVCPPLICDKKDEAGILLRNLTKETQDVVGLYGQNAVQDAIVGSIQKQLVLSRGGIILAKVGDSILPFVIDLLTVKSDGECVYSDLAAVGGFDEKEINTDFVEDKYLTLTALDGLQLEVARTEPVFTLNVDHIEWVKDDDDDDISELYLEDEDEYPDDDDF